MCGIAGLVAVSARHSVAELEAIAHRMGQQLVHRGPDSGGIWVDAAGGVALAHRRLSILDLSPEGAQPMLSESGRFAVTFNGEIYNHAELREDLAGLGHRFRGHSDTEVLLAAVEQWGVDGALPRFNGMFAFALWDRLRRLLHLARDRMGEKPLYYAWCGRSFVFGSEVKALREHPDFAAEIDRDALALFARHGCIPAPHSIYAGMRKLVPAGLLTVTPSRPGGAAMTRYWSHQEAALAGVEEPFRGTPGQAVAELEALLRDSVRLRMQADVPLGAFLSGGIDSSAVVALMQAQSSRPVKTFTIGFREDRYNEAVHAKAVARHLGTDHTELYVSPRDAMDVIPRLPAIYDEPFADPSQIPTFLVSQLTRRHVTVSLSGDGGDELFCGYTRYRLGTVWWRRLGWIPAPLRALGGRAVLSVPEAVWSGLGLGRTRLGARLRAGAQILRKPTAEAIYRELMSQWKEPTRLALGAREPPTLLADAASWPPLRSLTDKLMFVDALTYLPDDILVKVDRASMAVSLEARVPMLDHRLVELAWRLPLDLKRREGMDKWILRQVLFQHVPRELVERPKMGFGVPIDSWLRGPLREWAQDLLAPPRLQREGYLEPTLVQSMLRQHLSGARDHSFVLWEVLMFQAWLAEQSTRSQEVRAPPPGLRMAGGTHTSAC